jgi:hypothetical protein
MRGVYTAPYKISSVSAAKTLMYLTAPSGKVVEILSASVTNASNETNEQMECVLQRITSLGTPTATAVTPVKHEAGDQASGSTVAGNVTASEPTYTSDTELGRQGFASLGGWWFQPTPEERPTVANGASIGLRLLTAPTSWDLVVSITFREIG